MVTDGGLVLVNFSHPLTPNQLEEVSGLVGSPVERVIDRRVDFDVDAPFADQARALVDAVDLSSTDWQTSVIVINLPGHSVVAALVLAELHGRTGGFPAVLRLRRHEPLTTYEVAELIDLQAVRDAGRQARAG